MLTTNVEELQAEVRAWRTRFPYLKWRSEGLGPVDGSVTVVDPTVISCDWRPERDEYGP
jgi:hypothetical protein